MQTLHRIYLYKGTAYLKEENKGKFSYFKMPDDWSGWWQQCHEEEYNQAKYYGVPARGNIIKRKKEIKK